MRSTLAVAYTFLDHPHIIEGRGVAKARIIKHDCPSKVTYYVPIDASIRRMLILHPKQIPHSHVVAPPLKLTLGPKGLYRKAVRAAQAGGLVAATVAKVDNCKLAPSLDELALM